jgi:hypothetical protein
VPDLKRVALILSGVILTGLGYLGLVVGNVVYGGVDRLMGSSVSIQVGASPVPAAVAGAILSLGMCLGLVGVTRR